MATVFCRGCGKQMDEAALFCPSCGAPQRGGAENTVAPEGVKGWSWGAFLLNWIWAIFNRTWIGLLALLIPFVGGFLLAILGLEQHRIWPLVIGIAAFAFTILLGFKGREWAWKNKKWDSVEHFNRVQRRWSLWGVWIFAALCVVVVLATLVARQYPRYMQRVTNAQLNSQVATETPIASNSVSEMKDPKLAIVQVEIDQLAQALDLFKLEVGRYPSAQEGLQALIKDPGGVPNWHGPYMLKDSIRDPWGNDYKYLSSDSNGNTFKLTSMGSDGKEGGKGINADIDIQIGTSQVRVERSSTATTSTADGRTKSMEAQPPTDYLSLALVDLKTDIKSLVDRKVVVRSKVQLVGDMAMLKNDEMDMTPVWLFFDRVPREERRKLFECALLCDIQVMGVIGKGPLNQDGLWAESITFK